MKLTISLRKPGEGIKKSHSELPKGTFVDVAGANQISKRKQLIRERGAPVSTPGLGSKSHMNQIRKCGDIPAILYGPNLTNEMVTIMGDRPESETPGFQSVMREIKKGGLLATTIFELNDGKTVRKAIVKDIQYNVASYAVEHIDFLILDGDKPVTLNMPIKFVGLDECVGIKAGGFPRYVSRSLKVTCKPSEIPAAGFIANVKELKMPGTLTSADDKVALTVADVEIPEGIKATSKSLLTPKFLKQVVVSIAKK